MQSRDLSLAAPPRDKKYNVFSENERRNDKIFALDCAAMLAVKMSSDYCQHCTIKEPSSSSGQEFLDHAVCEKFQRLSPTIFSSCETNVRLFEIEPEAEGMFSSETKASD